jgi:hypothetical protein
MRGYGKTCKWHKILMWRMDRYERGWRDREGEGWIGMDREGGRDG